MVGILGFLAVLVVAGALVVVLAWGIVHLARLLFGPRRRLEEELGLEALERRLARGEITRAQFDQARQALGL